MAVDMELAQRLLKERYEILAKSAWVLVFEANGYEFSLFRNGRALVKGCKTESEAMAVYNRVAELLAPA